MAIEIIGSRRKLIDVVLLVRFLNGSLYIYVYNNRCVLLPNLVRDISFCRRLWLMYILTTVQKCWDYEAFSSQPYMEHLYQTNSPCSKFQGTFLKKECKQCKSQKIKRNTVKCCLLYVTWLLYISSHRSCCCLYKI